jgi:hypothetical protein
MNLSYYPPCLRAFPNGRVSQRCGWNANGRETSPWSILQILRAKMARVFGHAVAFAPQLVVSLPKIRSPAVRRRIILKIGTTLSATESWFRSMRATENVVSPSFAVDDTVRSSHIFIQEQR